MLKQQKSPRPIDTTFTTLPAMMQPRARIGLVRLVLFLLCASLVLAVRPKRGCETLPSNGQCPAAAGFNGGQLKCTRCRQSLRTLMDDELLHSGNEPVRPKLKSCEQKIDESARQGPDYSSSSTGGLEGCFTSGIMLYDGAVECREANVAGALSYCIGAPQGLYDCLCTKNITDGHIRGILPCFQPKGDPPVLTTSCPKISTKRPGISWPSRSVPAQNNNGQKPTRGKGKKGPGRGGTRRATEGDDSNNNAEDGSGDTSADGSNYDDDDDYDHEIDWPDPVDQFSPVLQDDGVAWYLDIYERSILVDPKTYVMIYYEPYILYTAPSFDQLFKLTDDARRLVRRCWFYPVSNNVWCWQWYINPDEYADYNYINTTATPEAYVNSVGGYTTIPSTYNSEVYTTAGPAPSRKVDAQATSSVVQSAGSDLQATSSVAQSSGSEVKTAKSSARPSATGASAAASQHGSKSWMPFVSLVALMCSVF